MKPFKPRNFLGRDPRAPSLRVEWLTRSMMTVVTRWLHGHLVIVSGWKTLTV